MPCGLLGGFREIGTRSGTRDNCHVYDLRDEAWPAVEDRLGLVSAREGGNNCGSRMRGMAEKESLGREERDERKWGERERYEKGKWVEMNFWVLNPEYIACRIFFIKLLVLIFESYNHLKVDSI